MSRHFLHANGERPQLLVSARNASEAAEALAGSAEVIDVKEPSRGPLGAADNAVVEQVLQCVAERRPVSVAAGELVHASVEISIPVGVRWVKFGLSQCANDRGWIERFAQMESHLPPGARIVPVVYADWREVNAPSPDDVLQLARDRDCQVVLVDTFDKRVGNLFEHWDFATVEKFVAAAHASGTAVALAGGLREEGISFAVAAGADVIGVRGAVCDTGRLGKLQRSLVERVVRNMNCDAAVRS